MGSGEKNETDEGLGQWCGNINKNRCPCETDKCDKSHGKYRESTAYLFGILDAGGAVGDALI